MAKITVHGGPTNEAAGPPSVYGVPVEPDEQASAPEPDETREPVEPAEVAGDSADIGEPVQMSEPEPEPEPERPAPYATKAEWVAYVVELTGEPEESVSSATKAELIERYGD